MFKESGYEHDPRSSGAQCFRQWVSETRSRFAPLERREIFNLTDSINISSLWDEEVG
jgi:hypothetical protein